MVTGWKRHMIGAGAVAATFTAGCDQKPDPLASPAGQSIIQRMQEAGEAGRKKEGKLGQSFEQIQCLKDEISKLLCEAVQVQEGRAAEIKDYEIRKATIAKITVEDSNLASAAKTNIEALNKVFGNRDNDAAVAVLKVLAFEQIATTIKMAKDPGQAKETMIKALADVSRSIDKAYLKQQAR